MKLLSVDDARARMLDGVAALPAESAPLDQAMGRVLAEPVIATRDQPPFASSIMDGWAVRRSDALDGAALNLNHPNSAHSRESGNPGLSSLASHGQDWVPAFAGMSGILGNDSTRTPKALEAPAELDIVGESAAGRGFAGTLGPGQAVRIFTGAAIPDGADRVVIQENAERIGDRVRLGPLANAPTHIRPRGADFRQGDVLLTAGQRLDPWRLSLVAAAGLSAVSVARAPRVAVLCTGEELVRAPTAPGPFQIYESASAALCALIGAWGGIAQRLEPARDDQASVIAAVSGVEADLIVTVGGASVGDYDIVKPALTQLGLGLKVASVNLRPGKPTWFGALGDGRRVLGLPGNPSSALVCAELFLRQLMRALQGADPTPDAIFAKLAAPLPANGPREHLMRAALTSSEDGSLLVSPFDDQDSGLVGVFARADALLRRPPNAPAGAEGEAVEVLKLDRL